MQCPVCKTASLHNDQLESNLATLSCTACGGHWIKSYQYWRWRDAHGRDLPELPPTPILDEASSVPNAGSATAPRLCPDCGHFMRRYPVGHETDIELERCGNCGGMWFDASEWESLRERNLHDDVHKVFSEVWQTEVFRRQRAEAREKLLHEMLGAEDLDKVRNIKSWLDKHPRRSELYALLHEGYPDHRLFGE
ncbi:zf-TFIIB domain-containing protein [Planctomycetales bacterium ZRK34]|nr:zf-TFIIB domain-containing protein [Planctomycetales bacterium ZRK34]